MANNASRVHTNKVQRIMGPCWEFGTYPPPHYTALIWYVACFCWTIPDVTIKQFSFFIDRGWRCCCCCCHNIQVTLIARAMITMEPNMNIFIANAIDWYQHPCFIFNLWSRCKTMLWYSVVAWLKLKPSCLVIHPSSQIYQHYLNTKLVAIPIL